MKILLIYCVLFVAVSFPVFSKDPIGTGKVDNGILSGVIRDKADSTAIIGAVIYIPDLKTGSNTDQNGKYVIEGLHKGIYLVQVSYVGYATITQKVLITENAVLNVQLQTSAVETGEVVITGMSKATEIKRAPVPMLAVGKAYIDQHSASGNVIDEIAHMPGISAVSTGPNISKPFIRGLGYNRVITAEDGIRQEGQQWGDEHGIEVDQNSIDRIEVIKGPASLTFGSDAIGGVVNLITAEPVPEGKISGALTALYGTNNGLINGSLKLQGNNHGLIWGTVISGKEAKNYQNQHDGRVYATNFKEKDARFVIGLNKSWGYTHLNASLFDDQQAIPDGSRDPVTRKFTRQITDADTFRPIVPDAVLNAYTIPVLHQHVQLYRIYNNSNFHIGDGNLLLSLGYQYSHRREFTHPEAAAIPGLNLELSTLTYDVKYNLEAGKGYEITAGINGMYQHNGLGLNSTNFPIPVYNQSDIGGFFIMKKSFGKLNLSGGIRFDIRSFNGQAAYIDTSKAYYPALYTGTDPAAAPGVIQQFSALKKTFSGITGSLGGTYIFSERFLLKANIARGFRAPSIAELSANGPDPGSQIYHIGNSSFKPEFSLQGDVGAFLTLPAVSASVELFENTIDHYIFQQQVLNADGTPLITKGYNTFTYVQSKARLYGGEIDMDIHPLSWLHFENEASLTYGTNLGTGGFVPDSLKYLPFIPPLHIHSELRGNFTKGWGKVKNMYAWVGFDHYSAQNRFFSAYGTETYTAGYNLLSAGIGASIVNAGGKEIVELFVEGTNLANVNYQSNMSRLKYFDNADVPAGVQRGIFNMGRNISFKVVVPFDLSPRK